MLNEYKTQVGINITMLNISISFPNCDRLCPNCHEVESELLIVGQRSGKLFFDQRIGRDLNSALSYWTQLYNHCAIMCNFVKELSIMWRDVYALWFCQRYYCVFSLNLVKKVVLFALSTVREKWGIFLFNFSGMPTTKGKHFDFPLTIRWRTTKQCWCFFPFKFNVNLSWTIIQ